MIKRRETERQEEPQVVPAQTNGHILADNDEMLSPNEAGRRTGFSRGTIMDMIHKGWLKAYRLPGTVVHKIKRSDLERLMGASCLGKDSVNGNL